MSLQLDRRELLKTFACASVSVGAGGAITSVVSAWAQTTTPRAGTPRISFVRAPLATGIIVHAGGTSMELYHKHPHIEIEELVQPEDIRLQTRLVMRNHKEILDWMGLGWRNVVKLTRYQKRMDESKQIDEVLASYFKDWSPAMSSVEISGLSSRQARLEIDMWVAPNEMAQATPGIIKGIDPIRPRPEVALKDMAFAPGVRVSRDMDLVYFSGITAYPPEVDPWNPGSFRLPADPAARSKMAADNLDRVLKAAGITWQHIIMQVSYAAPGGGGINFREQMGDWRPCSTSLQVTDTGIPGANVLYQITAVAPHRIQTTKGTVPGIEPILARPDMAFAPATPAIKVSRDLDLVYLSGMTAYPADVDPWNAGNFNLPESIDAQDRMATDNIDRTLRAAGITWQHVVLIARTGEAGSDNDMREKMGGWRPCRTTRAISTGVPGAKVLYEITAIAPRRI
jgi:enamine deaminase RidA (YjgF/YER057c/UK114 family)